MSPRSEDPKRGKSRPGSPDPLAMLIRELRTRRGLSLQALGRLVEASAPHLYNIESGRKLPSEELAVRIARELGMDPDAFRAWVQASGRSDWGTTRRATMLLDQFVREPRIAKLMADAGIDVGAAITDLRGEPSLPLRQRAPVSADAARGEVHEEVGSQPQPGEHGVRPQPHAGEQIFAAMRRVDPPGSWSRGTGAEGIEAGHLSEPPRATPSMPAPAPLPIAASAETGPARVLIPILEPGRDPDERRRMPWSRGPSLRLDPQRLVAVGAARPFAYPLGPGLHPRAAGALPDSGYAVLTREAGWPPVPGAIYAMRLARRIELAPVMWNGSEVLILPAPGRSDFIVVRAGDERMGRELLRGRVVLIGSAAATPAAGQP